MKKDFLTITPDNGGGSTDVTAVADPNPLMKERSTTINFSSGGGLAKAVNAVQNGVPYVMLQMNFPVYERNSQMTLRTWTSQLQNSDGVLVFKTSSNDYLSWASTEDNVMRLSFYSDSSNTFTFSGKGPGTENISGTFLKSGNIHCLNTELFTKVQSAVLGSLQTKVPLSIMMNGTVIQEYSITE